MSDYDGLEYWGKDENGYPRDDVVSNIDKPQSEVREDLAAMLGALPKVYCGMRLDRASSFRSKCTLQMYIAYSVKVSEEGLITFRYVYVCEHCDGEAWRMKGQQIK